MADTERQDGGGFFAFLLSAGIFITGVIRGLAGKRRVAAKKSHPDIDFKPGVGSGTGEDVLPEASTSGRKVGEPREHTALPTHFLIRPHWNQPMPESIPALTYAPATMALGIVLFALGLITRWYVAVVGGLIFARAIWLWIGDLIDE